MPPPAYGNWTSCNSWRAATRVPRLRWDIKAIERITKRKGTLKGYSVNAASEGKDALGEVTVHVDFGQPKPIVGKGASTDVIEASARAYLNAVNRSIRMENMPRPNNLDSGTI